MRQQTINFELFLHLEYIVGADFRWYSPCSEQPECLHELTKDVGMPETGQTFDDSLPHRFVSEIEGAVRGEYTSVQFPAASIIAIATNPSLRQKLLALIDAKQDGADIGKFTADLVEDVSDGCEALVNKAEGWIEIIDRSLLAVSAAAIIPSLVLMVSQAASSGMGWPPVLLFAGGVVSLVVSAGTRFTIRARVNSLKGSISKLKRLAEKLRRR